MSWGVINGVNSALQIATTVIVVLNTFYLYLVRVHHQKTHNKIEETHEDVRKLNDVVNASGRGGLQEDF